MVSYIAILLVGLLALSEKCLCNRQELFEGMVSLSSQYASHRNQNHESCSDPFHCKKGCQCVNRTCVNLEHFSAAVDTCHRCASNITKQCTSDGDKCYAGIGYCSKCSDRAVSVGVGSCFREGPERKEEETGDIDIVFAHEIASQVTKEPSPVSTPDIPVAVPPGISTKPTITPTPQSIAFDTTSDINVTPEVELQLDNGTTGIDMTRELDTSDCVDSNWIQLNGHSEGILKVTGTARVLCLKGKDLPCGTPGHLLKMCDNGICSLISYSNLCASLNGCTEKISTVARLRASYNWRIVSDGAISITSLSEGNSLVSQIIARVGYFLTERRLSKLVDVVSQVVVYSRRARTDKFRPRTRWLIDGIRISD